MTDRVGSDVILLSLLLERVLDSKCGPALLGSKISLKTKNRLPNACADMVIGHVHRCLVNVGKANVLKFGL